MNKILVLEEETYKEYPCKEELPLGKLNIYLTGAEGVIEEEGIKTQWDTKKEYQTKQGSTLLFLPKKVRCFQREKRIWMRSKQGDIEIPSLSSEVLLDGDTMHWKENSGVRVYWNGKRVRKSGLVLSEGDIVLLNQMKLTFLSDSIELEGEDYKTTLFETAGDNKKFEGFPFYKRSPRVIRKRNQETVEILKPPAVNTMSKGSLAQILLPPLAMLVLTITLSIILKRGAYIILSIGMTVITTIFSVQRFFSEKKDIKEKNERRSLVYEQYLVNVRKKIRILRAEEKETLIYQSPDLKTLEEMTSRYSSRIYERRAADEDFLEVTVGYKEGESAVSVVYKSNELELEKEELNEEAKKVEKDFSKIEKVPVTINLKRAHLGLVGSPVNIHEQLKYLLAQLTFFQSYHDLEIIYIHDEAYQKEFEYMRWYPHLRLQEINVTAQISNERVRDQVLGSVLEILKNRKQKSEDSKKTETFLPHLLFVIDEPRFIINHAIMEYLQEENEDLGFSLIYATNQMAKLPEYIRTVCILNNAEEGVLLLNKGERVNNKFEIVHTASAKLEDMARNLAALIHETGMSSKIPDSVTFFDLYKIKYPEELNLLERWKKHESHKSLAVPLGLREQDNIVELNLHEKAHGPHGLVAGTTGSGKSEIIQSYILSLAVNFHPHEVGFLLIDYKGGGMANLFRDLPHLLGTITNLDGSESIRAMISIKSELARRQRLFNANNVNHINGYNQLYKTGEVEEPIPHLFLISDEFAELKKEQPEFMKELVSAARIGRSLGIHLILATQKPSGVVDDQIWTNSKFKLCLKVQNEADSREMLKTPDAANITQAGRSYLQVGNNEIYELFQSAWSGAYFQPEQSEGEEADNRVYLLNQLGQGMLINQDLGGSVESNQIKETQLDVLVKYIGEVFKASKAASVKRPWLPPLGICLVSPYMQPMEDGEKEKELSMTVLLGLVDIPSRQVQEEYEVDFIRDGHLVFFASAGYGKSVFLTTLMLSLFIKNQVSNLHAYILDFGSSALISLKELPHIADYMTYDDTEKFAKFKALMVQEIKERKQILGHARMQNFELYNQCIKEKLPAILITIDNFDVVKELGIEAENFFAQIARDGISLGIYLVITASRSSVVKHALLSNIKVKIAGYNFEPTEARTILGKSEFAIPEIKGRALVKQDSIDLMQIYSPVPFRSNMEYNENLRRLIEEIQQKSREKKAIGIPVLPEQFTYDMVSNYKNPENSDIILGLRKGEVELAGIHRTDSPFLVIGPAKSGKTNAVRLMISQMLDWEKIYLFDSIERDCARFKNSEKVYYIDQITQISNVLMELTEMIEERKEQYLDELEEREISPKEFYESIEKVAICINSIDNFMQLTKGMTNVTGVLEKAVETGIFILFIGNSTKMLLRDDIMKFAKSSIYGLVLGDQGSGAPFSVSRLREIPTVVEDGLLFQNGNYETIRIPQMLEEV